MRKGSFRDISVIGLGYVGLPVAVAFGRRSRVVGFDINAVRVRELQRGVDRNRDVTRDDLAEADVYFTDDAQELRKANFHIVTVPTPVDSTNRPDLRPLIEAARIVGRYLNRGDIVVFESTVYPGTTEEVCIPVLEQSSNLANGRDFAVGYSPERISPGSEEHTFDRVAKIVSAQNEETLHVVACTYETVVSAGIHRVSNIKVAEAAKIVENVQRDVNIALMNELALMFGRMGIDTHDVLAAADTKWNFQAYTPGLVGGHCIGADPYYLTYKAAMLNYDSQFVLAGRRINDGMGTYIASQVLKYVIRRGVSTKTIIVTILGFTFKENVSDIRNTKVVDIISELESYELTVQVHDPRAEASEARRQYGVELLKADDLKPADAIVLAVAHSEFLAGGWPGIANFLREKQGGVFDIKGVLDRGSRPDAIYLWRL